MSASLSIGAGPGAGSARAGWLRTRLLSFAVLVAITCISTRHLTAQTGGQGAITGTVQDSTGAVVPNATVTAHNDQTGVDVTRTSSSAGLYEISPLNVGTYTVKASAAGFQQFQQQQIVINQGQTFGLNIALKVGNANETVTVSSAPPQLDTADATLGGTLSSDEFLNLPLMVAGNQQRDITSFSNLLPGAQPGSRSSLFSGTANRVQEVYLDGIPLTTISQIGDNRPIFNLVPAEGIGQLGATTSGASVEYQGAGSVNYTLKSGGNGYHGSVADFVRNTIFDTWGFTAPAATVPRVVNGIVTPVPAGKPIDHQNELSVSAGGPIIIPHVYDGRNKLFVFGAYDRVHTRSAPAYTSGTVPTLLMRQGNFSELLTGNNSSGVNYPIYDPLSAVCTGALCTRSQFKGAFNGVPTNNVIPAAEISPIAKTMQSFLPPPINSSIQNNYIGGSPTGYDNWLYSVRIDYTVSPKQTIAAAVTGGNRTAFPWTSNSVSSVPSTILPLPYIGTTYTTVAGHWADLSDTYTFTPHVVNQFKYGFSNFGGPPARNVTQNVSAYEAVNLG
ncbi:MAG TPA: carboxypeptidase-like regulatory domain-containing protein, partial [Acidobacteriaceae bacterium]